MVMNRLRYVGSYLLLVLLVSQIGLAQSNPAKFRFEHITVNEGLSHSDAMTVAQDPYGFIWTGTNKGIDRYDGYELKNYTLPINALTGSVSNRVRAVYADAARGVWVGAERTGLHWYDPTHDRFISIVDALPGVTSRAYARQLAQTDVLAITADGRGRIWIGTAQYGLFMLTVNAQGRPAALRQLSVSVARSPAATDNYTISELVVDQQQHVWIGTLGGGLWRFDAGNPQQAMHVPAFSTANIRALYADWRGDLWVGTDQQVFWRKKGNGYTESGFQPLSSHSPNPDCFWLDSFGRLWIGTNYGLFMHEADTTGQGPPIARGNGHPFLPLDTDPFSLNSGRIHQIMEDQFHNLWLATSAGGLSKINLLAKPFGHLRRQVSGSPTLSNNYINAICKDEQHNWLWIGTRNGFSSYDLATKTYHDFLNQSLTGGAPGIDVSALTLSANGTLWIGTRYSGLYTLTQTGRETHLNRQPERAGQQWSGTAIESIVEDRFGTLWVATSTAGLYRLNGQGRIMSAYNPQTRVVAAWSLMFLLYEQEKDVLWASTRDKGLLKLQVRPDTLLLTRTFGHDPAKPNGLRSTYIWPLLRDKAGTLWIGTIGGGLHRLVTDKRGHETVQNCTDWLPETDIESLLTDDGGNLWIGGGGLYQLNPTNRHYLHYDVADGLQSNAFKVGAACRAANGMLYFGGINGITYFAPQTFWTKDSPPPLIQLTGLRIMNRSVGIGDTINGRVLLGQPLTNPHPLLLKSSENDFSIDFVGLSYVNPRNSHYAYKLDGYNADWVQPAPGQRSASFANLPAGSYTFQAKVRNGDGIWSENLATLPITILPPWWRTSWAYLVYAVVAVGALVAYRRITSARRELENSLVLEKFKVEKEKEVTDLKLDFFTNVSHELRTPLTLIIGPMEELMTSVTEPNGVKEKVTLMHRQTRKLLDLVNQLLDFRKVESGHVTLRASRGDVVSFLTEIFLMFRLKADENHLDFVIDAPAEAIPIYFDRGKLEIIMTNLLSNALKYTSPGGTIRLAVTAVGEPDQQAEYNKTKLENNYLKVSVFNQCIGLSDEEISKLFDPYYQASQTESLRVLGTGIGLSLVKQLVDRHAGEIAVTSQLDVGVTFTLRLPFGQAHLSSLDIQVPVTESYQITNVVGGESATPHRPSPVASATDLPRILIVDDNDDLRQYLQQLFEPTFEVITAVDGLDGWAKTLEFQPDLVLSDIMMPRSDGLELCQMIKQNSLTMHIPVVLLTARSATVHELEGLELGGDDYIVKPFNPQLLYAKVQAIVQNRLKLRAYYQGQIRLEPNEVTIPDADRLFLETAMHIVEANLSESTFNVPLLVREMGVSQSSFYRRIKSITGQSVVEFIRDVRLKRAAVLLTTSSLRVSEVAAQVGIDDVKYFRQMFQKLYGQSPSTYGKQPAVVGSPTYVGSATKA